MNLFSKWDHIFSQIEFDQNTNKIKLFVILINVLQFHNIYFIYYLYLFTCINVPSNVTLLS